MSKSNLKHAGPDNSEIGWREMIGLPDLGIEELRAKIDTGARTSALHAINLEFGQFRDNPWVSFHVPRPGISEATRCMALITDRREIKNTSGVSELRTVIETTLVLGSRHWHIEVSLADRENMEFDLILGRTAVRGRHLLVNPSNSFLAGPPLGQFAMPKIQPINRNKRTPISGKKPSGEESTKGHEQ